MTLSIRLLLGALAGALGLALGAGVASASDLRPAPTCTACVLVDDGGRTLWARAPETQLPNASTTKMVTALVAVDAGIADDEVRVSRAAAATGQGGFDLSPGETYEGLDLLYALLLTSSNDAAVAIAEHVAGSEAAFVERMNEAASELGATGTQFETSHGLDTPGHVSTARDLARIAVGVLENETLGPIVADADARIDTPGGTALIENTNPLLDSYRGAVGVKTGSTVLAGDVLVAAARRHGRTLIAVAMHSDSAAADAAALLDFGFRRLSHSVLLRSGQEVGALVFDPAGAIAAVAATSVRGWAVPEGVATSFRPDPSIEPPLAPGERVGTVVVERPGEPPAIVDALAAGEVPADDDSWLETVIAGLVAAVGTVATELGARL